MAFVMAMTMTNLQQNMRFIGVDKVRIVTSLTSPLRDSTSSREAKFLPGTGRWRGEAVTEGARLSFECCV